MIATKVDCKEKMINLNFFKKRKKNVSSTVRNVTNFGKAFEKRLGQDPVSYVTNKLASGSDLGAIRQLFDILAAEVELRDKCKCPGFDFYYEKVLRQYRINATIRIIQQVPSKNCG